jgi:hypothetical protein
LGPEMRLAGTRLESELLPLVCQSAARLSSALGYCPAKEAIAEISLPAPKPKRKTRRLATEPYVFGELKTCC